MMNIFKVLDVITPEETPNQGIATGWPYLLIIGCTALVLVGIGVLIYFINRRRK